MRRRLLISLFALLVLETPLLAATRTWTGTTSGTWSVASNWGGTAPSAGDDLVFSSGTNGSSMNNDYPANTAFHSLTFNVTQNFNLAGNAIDIGAGGITITGGASFNTGTPLTLTAAQTWSCNAPGELFTQQIDLGANTLNVTGTGNFFFQQTMSGTGGITIGGTPVVTFSATNLNYTGPTTVSSGATVQLESPGNIATPFVIGSGGTFFVPAGSIPTIANTLALNSGSTDKVQINGPATAQYSQAAASGRRPPLRSQATSPSRAAPSFTPTVCSRSSMGRAAGR